MIDISNRSIGDVFAAAALRHPARDWLIAPADPARAWHPQGVCIGYARGAALVESLARDLAEAGYGPGHRLAFLLGNRPEMLVLKLACNRAGVCWVPVNPDYRDAEIAWLLQDSGASAAFCTREYETVLRAGLAMAGVDAPIAVLDDDPFALHPSPDEGRAPRTASWVPPARAPAPTGASPPPSSRTREGPVGADTEASLLYTSGTTGRPKGCILSHGYELEVGAWYASRGGRIALREGVERVYCPLPLFHVNAGILLAFGMIVSGNCQIVAERFSRSRWWAEIRATRASAMHYLGIVVATLMNEPPSPDDRDHGLRWGLGAGVEPSLHGAFERRFGCPLVELWGMTEMCRILVDCHEPRRIDTRAMGRPQPGLEVRVVDQADREVAPGERGELLVRHSAGTPRKGAFSGYLNLPDATEHAWRGGWFHTGDTVFQEADGMVHFVDRSKNIIRRAGENIAAAEVEACLQAHPRVQQVAVLAIDDEVRDEEVMACVVLAATDTDAGEDAGAALARELFDHAFARLAYFKAPGWIVFLPGLPVTGTQKIAKHRIFGEGQDPRRLAGAHDLRALKRRQPR
ncbi:MAG: AMP-binding protein [Lautropia sp.]